jgi:hypothetical protein
MKNEEQIYQKQIAQTIASLVGENFQPVKSVTPAIALRQSLLILSRHLIAELNDNCYIYFYETSIHLICLC